MTPVLGNHSSSQVAAGTSQSFSHTNNGSVVVARIGLVGAGAMPASITVTYAGLAMTQISSLTNTSGTNQIETFFILYGAPAGANTFAVSWSNTASGLCAITSLSYSLYRTPATNSGTSVTPSISCTTIDGDLVLEGLSVGAGGGTVTATATGSQTTQDNLQPDIFSRDCNSQQTAPGTSIVFSWSLNVGRPWVEIAIAFYDPPAAGTPIAISPVLMF